MKLMIKKSQTIIFTLLNLSFCLAFAQDVSISADQGMYVAPNNLGTLTVEPGVTIQASIGQPGISSYYSIETINNYGSVHGFGLIGDIYTSQPITTFNNAQTTGSSRTFLWEGILPTNYNVIIQSPSNYGQLDLWAAASSGSTSFGIAAGSIVARGTYQSVLQNFTPGFLNNTSGTYNGFSWTLVNSSYGTWDLVVSGASSADTLASMTPNASALRGAFIQQSAIINNGLSYDCTTFDAKGICVSAGGRVTDANNPSTNSQGALLIASYRANDNWRIGGYLDQNLSSNDPRGVNLENNNPMAGVFAVWNQNTDGTGYQVRVAAGYSDKDVTISRSAFGATGEAGKGDSSLRTQAYSATVSRGIQLNDSRWIASPYVGVRYTKIKRAGYTEDSDVTAPLTYSGLSQETTTALAGVRFNGQLAEKVNVMASVGVESDIAHNTGDYAATGVNDLTPITFNHNIRHVRPVAQAGVSYAIDKRQTVSANLLYRQEAFNSSYSTTGMVTYQVGF